jgi:hypothetical protein
MTAPAGTTLQVTTIQWGQVLTTNGTNQTYTGYNAPDVSNESWYLACPNNFPNLNFATVAAYGESNSTLIQCGP